MSRNYEQHPEMFPLSRSDYDPDLNGWGGHSDAQGLPVAKAHRAEGPVSRSTFQDDAGYLGVKAAAVLRRFDESRRKTMNEVVKFPINTPVEVTLQDEAGKWVEGRYGDQVMYSL